MDDLYNPIIKGSISGGIGYFSTLPLDYIKQNFQSGNNFIKIKNDISKNGFTPLEI